MYCLDSNIVIDIFRNNISTNVKEILEEEVVYTNPIILSELFKGCFLSDKSEAAFVLTNNYVNQTKMLEFDIPSCKIFGKLNAELSKKGRLTETSDLMIAAICITHNATLVTKNKKHFQNIPGLKVEYV